VLPALLERFFEDLAHGSREMGIPVLEPLARLEQPPVDVPEHGAAGVSARLVVPAASLVDDHLVGVALEAKSGLVDQTAGRDHHAHREIQHRQDELLETVPHQEREADEAASVVDLAEVARRDHAGGPGVREAVGQLPDLRSGCARQLRSPLGSVGREVLPQQGEDRAHADLPPVREGDLEASLEGGLDALEAEGPPPGRDDASLDVVEVELVPVAALSKIGAAQVAVRVLAHQER
jgi:hypothetical protein